MNEDQIILNYALLFEPAFSAELIEASRSIAKYVPLEYELGSESVPHLTVLQFSAPESSAADAWARLDALEVPPLSLNFNGLALTRWRSWDVVWLRPKHCARLRQFQDEAREILGNPELLNASGDGYDPHVTLGAWPSRDHVPSFPIPVDVVGRRDVCVHPAMGASGPAYQFARTLFAREA